MQVLFSIVPVAIIGFLVCNSVKEDKNFTQNIYNYNKECLEKAWNTIKGETSPETVETTEATENEHE